MSSTEETPEDLTLANLKRMLADADAHVLRLQLENERLRQASPTLSSEQKPVPKLTQQWTALSSCTTTTTEDKEYEYLQSYDPLGLPFPPIPSEIVATLLIRKSYHAFFDLFLKMVDSQHEYPVSGTPGIGKSYLLIFLLWKIRCHQKFRSRSILFHHSNDFHYFRNDGQAFAVIESRAKELMLDESTIYMVDGSEAVPLTHHHTTIYVSSPRHKHFTHWCKHQRMTPYYMPIWTESELEVCRIVCHSSISISEVQDRYSQYGGIPRFVFWSKASPLPSIEAAVSDVSARLSLSLVGEQTQNARSSHMLIHLIADDNFRLLYADLASDYVGILLFEKYNQETFERMQSMLGTCSALAGHLFQCFMHYKFIHSIDLNFKCRSLEKQGAKQVDLRFDQLAVQTFSELPNKLKKNTYYQPQIPNFPAFDALTDKGFLQFTIAASHTIKGVNTIKKAVGLYEDETPVPFYFFVPHTNFSNFKKQDIQSEAKEPVEIAQYVVKVDIGVKTASRKRARK